MTIGEFFGTLQECITAGWRAHLQTSKYSKHMALDEFYKEMPEKVDALIEAYQADNEVVTGYANLFRADDYNALEMLRALKDLVVKGRKEFCTTTSLESLADDVLNLIDSTIYKVSKLTESVSLSDYLASELL